MGLIEHPEGLKFTNIYVYSKSLYQPKYQRLKKIMSGVPEIGYYEFSDDVPSVEEVKKHSLVIFDDVSSCKDQKNIQPFFAYGRHRGLKLAFLIQTYTKILKHLLRDNFNMIVLFKQDQLHLKHVFDEHVIGDMKFDEFLEMCRVCWQKPYGYLVVDKQSEKKQRSLSKGFDEFFILDTV